MKPKVGRPSLYSLEMAENICILISEGNPLTSICKHSSLPTLSTVFKWLAEHLEFSDMYARAREIQADVFAAQITELADENPKTYTDGSGATKIDPAWVNNQKNRIDARKWTASKLKPKKYGDAIKMEHSKEYEVKALSEEELDSKLSVLLNKAGYEKISETKISKSS